MSLNKLMNIEIHGVKKNSVININGVAPLLYFEDEDIKKQYIKLVSNTKRVNGIFLLDILFTKGRNKKYKLKPKHVNIKPKNSNSYFLNHSADEILSIITKYLCESILNPEKYDSRRMEPRHIKRQEESANKYTHYYIIGMDHELSGWDPVYEEYCNYIGIVVNHKKKYHIYPVNIHDYAENYNIHELKGILETETNEFCCAFREFYDKLKNEGREDFTDVIGKVLEAYIKPKLLSQRV